MMSVYYEKRRERERKKERGNEGLTKRSFGKAEFQRHAHVHKNFERISFHIRTVLEMKEKLPCKNSINKEQEINGSFTHDRIVE